MRKPRSPAAGLGPDGALDDVVADLAVSYHRSCRSASLCEAEHVDLVLSIGGGSALGLYGEARGLSRQDA